VSNFMYLHVKLHTCELHVVELRSVELQAYIPSGRAENVSCDDDELNILGLL
jgi:hypothetical protein